MATWHTVESATAGWSDAPNADELEELLETAQDAVLEYAKPSDFPLAPDPLPDPFDYAAYLRADDTVIKARWRRAQLLSIKDEWNSEKEASSSDSDAQGFDGVGGTARVYRLSMRVKRILRPESASSGLVG